MVYGFIRVFSFRVRVWRSPPQRAPRVWFHAERLWCSRIPWLQCICRASSDGNGNRRRDMEELVAICLRGVAQFGMLASFLVQLPGLSSLPLPELRCNSSSYSRVLVAASFCFVSLAISGRRYVDPASGSSAFLSPWPFRSFVFLDSRGPHRGQNRIAFSQHLFSCASGLGFRRASRGECGRGRCSPLREGLDSILFGSRYGLISLFPV